jgi:hypothetical protein
MTPGFALLSPRVFRTTLMRTRDCVFGSATFTRMPIAAQT